MADLQRAYEEKVRFRARRQAQFRALRDVEPLTKDGKRITLQMNAGLLVDLPHLNEAGAEGIGLFRTELQFMIASTMPKAEEQEAFYRNVMKQTAGKPVTFRTLDIGGDKVVPYFRAAEEENPALGWRAIRLSLDRPGLLRTQFRAMLRATAGAELKMMLPMVTEVAELKSARELLQKEIERQSKLGEQLPRKLQFGAMLEVPALLWQLDELMAEVDFVSVGSNDLFQFAMAVDRGNARVSERFDILGRPFLRILREIVRAGERNNTPVTLCGEMASKRFRPWRCSGSASGRFRCRRRLSDRSRQCSWRSMPAGSTNSSRQRSTTSNPTRRSASSWSISLRRTAYRFRLNKRALVSVRTRSGRGECIGVRFGKASR